MHFVENIINQFSCMIFTKKQKYAPVIKYKNVLAFDFKKRFLFITINIKTLIVLHTLVCSSQ